MRPIKSVTQMAYNLLKRLSNFVELSAAERDAVREAFGRNIHAHRPRTHIIHRGDDPTHVHLFLDGWAYRYKVLDNGRRQILGFLVPGDLCDINVFILKRMDHAIETLTPGSVAAISRESLGELTSAFPKVMKAMWWDTLVSHAIQREWLLNLGQRPAAERIAHLLCELFVRLRCVGLTDGLHCDFPPTQVDLADATGLSPVHVNRSLQQLRSSDLIEWKGRTLTIPDFAILANFAQFNADYLHLDRVGIAADAEG